MTINDQATRMTARVAPYRDAILKARGLGLTWPDLCAVLGLEASPDRLRAAVRLSVRYSAKQIPLPLDAPTPEPAPPSIPQEQPYQGLDRLLTEYPPATRGVGALVLREFTAIKEARLRGWGWAEIADALGKPRTEARGVANAFARVHRRIEAGELVAPPTVPNL